MCENIRVKKMKYKTGSNSLIPPFSYLSMYLFLRSFVFFFSFSLVSFSTSFQSGRTLVTPVPDAASAFFARDLSRVAVPSKFAFPPGNLIIPTR